MEFNGLEGRKQIDEMQARKACGGSNYLPVDMQENVYKELQEAIEFSFSEASTIDKLSYAPQVGINFNNSHMYKPGKNVTKKILTNFKKMKQVVTILSHK